MKKLKRVDQVIWIEWGFKSLILSAIIFSTSVFSFEYQAYEKKITNGYSLRSAVEKMPRRDLEDTLRDFVSSTRPSRVMGSPGHQKAQEYLEKRLKNLTGPNVTFSKQEFTSGSINFIWEKKGATKPDEVIILGAGYDTILRDFKKNQPIMKGEMPGADSNASGVALLLSMMEIYNKLDLPKTVRIVFFDSEEFNSMGSKEFAKKTKAEMGSQKLVGFVNLTMLAHDTRIGDKEKRFNNMNYYVRPKDQPGAEQDVAFGLMFTENGKRNYNIITFLPKETFSGDFFPRTAENFWAEGIPAITMTQNRDGDMNPRYLTSNDFVETLNINTMTNVFKYVTSAVLAWNYDIVK